MSVSFQRSSPLACLLFLVAAAAAQAPTLVRDIYPGIATPNPGSDPRFAVNFASEAYFTAERDGRRLWHTDGTAAGTVMVATGDATVLGPLAHAGGTLFFVASSPATGAELWAFDPAHGAALVRDIAPGSAGAGVGSMVAVGSRLFFAANDGTHGRELWVSDGTGAGTTLVRDIHQGSADPDALVAVGGVLYFAADDGVHGRELWRSDGTAAGTVMVADIVLGATGSQPRELTALGGLVFFSADEGTQRELWRSDGTAAGTARVVDLDGANSGDPVRLLASGGHLWFVGTTQAAGAELWWSDGTAGGTRLVDDGVPGPVGSQIEGLAAFAGGVLLTAWRPTLGHELFFSDGTTPRLLGDLAAGVVGSHPTSFLVVGGQAYFAYYVAPGQWQVARTGGVPGDIVDLMLPSTLGAYPTLLTAVGNLVLFTTDQDQGVGREPWITDGTPRAARLLADLNATARSSSPRAFAELDGRSLFLASDGVHGTEIWTSDGTANGTDLMVDLVLGSPSPLVGNLARRGHRLYFVGRGPQNAAPFRLWQTDGTAAGTQALGDLPNAPFGAGVTAAGPGLFMPVIEFGTTSLMFSDGATAPQTLATFSFLVTSVAAFDGAFWLAADDGRHGLELWRSDGTVAGTALFVDLAPGAASANVSGLVVAGDRLFFAADDGTHGFELWSTDGTVAGTRLHEIAPGALGSLPSGAVALGSRLCFAADDGSAGAELWIADGTPGGTVRVADIDPSGSSWPLGLAVAGDRVFFSAATSTHGRELWVSDGTAAGTRLVADVWPGPASGMEAAAGTIAALGSDARIVFAADDGVHGLEPWTSDGSTAGTAMFADVNPGPPASRPAGFASAGARVFFRATSYLEGEELHAIALADVAAPLAVAYGAGCAGSFGALELAGQGLPTLTATFAYHIARGPAQAAAGLVLATRRVYLPLPGGCELLVSADGVTLPLVTDGGGEVTLALRVPADPLLLGAEFFAQAWVADAGGAFAGALSVSNGLHAVVGR